MSSKTGHPASIMNTPFHLVDRSPWPFFCGLAALQLPFTLLTYIDSGKVINFVISLILLLAVIRRWAKDVIAEGTYQGMHTRAVQKSIILGYLLFILSEIMLFASFFGSYFYYIIEPSL